ncbi:hypothetical protein BKA70DRAFT_1570581 [Coprinopsis sp. MPI-PUGE-AT-0042]|nr:hypothetical protein BKA70DRAFT_1570581 [Coprinopsis sp. MPI-PUGE-AT-0042]
MLLPKTPFQSKLGTNYVPSDIEITTINNVLLKVDGMVAQLEMQIEALKAKHAAVSSFAASHRALLSPIRRVPADILTTIFLLCKESYEKCAMTPDEPPLLFTRVCHQWRELVINTPTLWADFHINIPSCPTSFTANASLSRDANEQEEELLDVENSDEADAVMELADGRWQSRMQGRAELLKLWLERGSECPLSVSIAFDPNGLSALGVQVLADLLSLICKHASRWVHMDLSSYHLIPSELLPVAASQATQLRSLSLGWNIHAIPPDSFINGPSLRRLSLPHPEGKSYFDDLVTVHWGNLTELSIFGHPSLQGTEPTILLAILKKCPALVQCELNLAKGTWEFAHLTVYSSEEDSTTSAFFDALDVPSLHSLTLIKPSPSFENIPGEPPLFRWLKRWGNNLRNLEIGCCRRLSAAQLIQALELTPNVEDLTVNLAAINTDDPPPEPLDTEEEPGPGLLFKNSFLKDIEVGAGERPQPLCPKLRSLRLFTYSSDIAAKAVVRVVRSRQQDTAGATQLQHVIIRFQMFPYGFQTGEEWSPPGRWRQEKLNASVPGEHTIRVEWPNREKHDDDWPHSP